MSIKGLHSLANLHEGRKGLSETKKPQCQIDRRILCRDQMLKDDFRLHPQNDPFDILPPRDAPKMLLYNEKGL